MNELKERKPAVKITLISGREIIANVDLNIVEKAIEFSKMLKIDWMLINSSSISTVELYEPDKVEDFIFSITDLKVRSKLLQIRKERKEKGLSLNSVQHLMQIYTDRFWEISNVESNKW